MDPITQQKSLIKNAKIFIALCLALTLAVPRAWSAPSADEGDDSYRFLAGLVEKGLFDLAAKEGTSFLKNYPSHGKRKLARYRLAGALFELERSADAAQHYRQLAGQGGFEYRAESSFRLGQCLFALEQLGAAKQAFENVRELEQAYLNGPATFFLAETEFRLGNTQAAEGHYAEFLERFKDAEYLAGARRGLVWCAWKEKEGKRTIQRAKAFLKQHGDEEGSDEEGSDEMRILLGEAYLEEKQPELALSSFRLVTSKAFGDAHRRGAGFALAAQKKHGPAAGEFALLLRDFPKSRFAPEARLQLGLQALRAGNADAAVRALTLAIRDQDPEAYFWLAEAQEEKGEPRAALRALESALKLKPSQTLKARIHASRGDLLNATGRKKEALSAYSESGSDYALFAAAVTSLNEGDSENAIGLVETLLKTRPKSQYRLQALLVRGEAYFAAERHEKAIQAFQAVLAAQPDSAQGAQAQGRIAWSLYQSGQPKKALRSFAVLVKEYPDQVPAEEGLYMLGRVAMEAGETQRSIEAGRHYLERYPEGAQRAEVLFSMGQVSEGKASLPFFQKLVSQHAEHGLLAAALLELGERRSELGQTEAAVAHYRQLLSSQPRSDLVPEALYGLGWCLYNLGDFAGSAKELSALNGHRAASDSLRQAGLELAVWSHSKAGDPASASDAWRALTAISQDEGASFESLRTVLACWSSAGRAQQAQALLGEFLRDAKDSAVIGMALLESAYLALESGDLELAEHQLQGAKQSRHDAAGVAQAAFFVGEARFAAGEHERAAALYRGASALDNPMRANAYYKLGFALMKRADLAGAAQAFGSLVSDHPDSELFGEALFLQGEALFQSDQLEAAIACFERLRQEASGHQVLPKALFRMGIAQGRLKLWSACETSLTLLARKAPEFPNLAEAELWRGRALAAQRKRRAARQAFERVVSLDKGELAARARLGLGRLLESEGRADEALSEYLRVAYLYAHDEEVAEALFRAGTCLEAQGNREQAIAQFDEVVTKHPKAKFADQAQARLNAMNGKSRG